MRRRRQLRENDPEWIATRPDFASSPEEVERAVARNSIQRGLFILQNLTLLNVDGLLAQLRVIAESYDREEWVEQANEIGIDSDVLGHLDELVVPWPYYFCTPELLIQNPSLLLYYRNVTMVSQKVMRGLGMDTALYETRQRALTEATADHLAHYFNSVSSGLLRHHRVTATRHLELLYANMGDSLGGAWRNEIGRLAYVTLLRPLIVHLHQRNALKSVRYRLKGKVFDDSEDEQGESQQAVAVLDLSKVEDLDSSLDHLESQRVIFLELQLLNGRQLEINRQLTWVDADDKRYKIGPDLYAISADRETITWSAELKGGADPAGSDEHWKTARSALNRIALASQRTGRATPALSFIATILVDRVAREAALLIERGELHSVHNLTHMIEQPAKMQHFLNEVSTFLGYPTAV